MRHGISPQVVVLVLIATAAIVSIEPAASFAGAKQAVRVDLAKLKAEDRRAHEPRIVAPGPPGPAPWIFRRPGCLIPHL